MVRGWRVRLRRPEARRPQEIPPRYRVKDRPPAKGKKWFGWLLPFFVFAGALMAEGGMAWRLVAFAQIFVGFLRGGLAMVNVLASMFFGGISGSSIADVSSIGSIMIPMMKKQGYDDAFSVNITISSATTSCGLTTVEVSVSGDQPTHSAATTRPCTAKASTKAIP